jgi:pimeloyl-ACP methyl ester carboxylesterase
VIAPEHPGFAGKLPDWMMSTGDLAFFYLDLLRRLDLGNVHLVGHSIGGWIAAEIAIRSTGRIRSLSLLAPAGVAVADAAYPDIFLCSPEETLRRQFEDTKLAEEELQAQGERGIDLTLQNRAALARLAWNPRWHNPQLPHWLHLIDVPTLLIWGEDDRIVPFACHKPFLQEISGAKLIALPGVGHADALLRPEAACTPLNSFFREAER